ncbi:MULTISPECIES: hypothetical protein [unclassified Nocardioides]|uniref:hypothetical protein n=1 Tax=unclassified Nocardioides TaxID=2615069 RepID=UPI00138ED12C|nr:MULTISPECIES: hypothetical protein [unclassified Nocardioides]
MEVSRVDPPQHEFYVGKPQVGTCFPDAVARQPELIKCTLHDRPGFSASTQGREHAGLPHRYLCGGFARGTGQGSFELDQAGARAPRKNQCGAECRPNVTFPVRDPTPDRRSHCGAQDPDRRARLTAVAQHYPKRLTGK